MISGYQEAFDGRLLTWDARIVQHWSSRVIGLSRWAKWERVHPDTSGVLFSSLFSQGGLL